MSTSKEYTETDDKREARLILSGQWFYDDLIPKPVRIFALNYDFYYDLDDGYHDEGEKPELNCQGEQYVVVWHNDPFFSASDFPSTGFMNVNEAKDYALSVVKNIEWQNPYTKDYV